MTRILPSLLALGLVACSGGSGSVALDDTASGAGIDDTGTGSGTDDTGGGGGDDTGEEPGDPTLTFLVDGDTDDLALELHLMDFGTFDSLDVVGSAAVVDGEARLFLEEPDDSDLISLADDGWPDTWIAIYYGSLFVDDDGDTELSGDESYRGLGLHTPVFVKGEMVDGWEDIGIQEGWNVLRNRQTDGEPYVMDTQQILIDENALPVESIELGGDLASDVADPGLAVVSAATLFAGQYLTPLVDGPASGSTWSVELDGAPDPDHIQEWESAGLEFAYEFPLLYADNDGNDFVSEGDEGIGLACTEDGIPAAAIWIPPAEDLTILLAVLNAGFDFGWSAVSVGDEWTRLDDSELDELSMGTDCSLEE